MKTDTEKNDTCYKSIRCYFDSHQTVKFTTQYISRKSLHITYNTAVL